MPAAPCRDATVDDLRISSLSFRRQVSDASGVAVLHLPEPLAGSDAVREGPLAGALALPLNGGAPGPVVIDPLTAAGMPFELGMSFPPAVVRGTPALPPVPSVPAVRSSVWLHPAASNKVHAINTPLRTWEMGGFMLGSRLVGPGVAERCASPSALSHDLSKFPWQIPFLGPARGQGGILDLSTSIPPRKWMAHISTPGCSRAAPTCELKIPLHETRFRGIDCKDINWAGGGTSAGPRRAVRSVSADIASENLSTVLQIFQNDHCAAGKDFVSK